ncbi:Protein of unknown function DUF22 [Methanococcus aeolicus Nankai-3]|jgi:hypothetical protein|uniref:DUF22 domain-containing protein n=1 Tax=Methanococcus aeolicus (strain ATCC BAA-1280 / DSM 17508 / OCM 812 / Nankai-3) TaxID=419665 RepID=A6UT38_META3|nr:DUF22 domain-containing protein [Methanococcus aeolicus]ABR55660.1 Protein of unknown function DUF22 [Methanococcus aeolicus Nankai-3]
MFKVSGRIEKIEEALKEKKYPGKIIIDVQGKKEPIIASEAVEVKAGEIKKVAVNKIEIHPNNILFISAYAKHQLGHTLSVGEEIPMPFDSKRIVEHAIFIAIKDGIVKKGDIIGNLIILHGE